MNPPDCAQNKNNSRARGKVLLVSMPFASALAPSVQLGTLSSYLNSRGIPVDVHHAYLRCADHLSPDVYDVVTNAMVNECFYPHFLFPEHFSKHRKNIERHYDRIAKAFSPDPPVRLEEVLRRLRSFHEELLGGTDYSQYVLVGFSVTYDQLKPSLYLAREIKQRHPEIKTVFGGAQCTEQLGTGLMKTFSEIDFIVSGEGEATLEALCENLSGKTFEGIRGLGWRENESVRFNGAPDALDLRDLPVPDYDQYFSVLDRCTPVLKTVVRNNMGLPVESSRGCWWNKCTFCNLNTQYRKYREKPVKKVIAEVRTQVSRYQCHSLTFIDNIQRVKSFGLLMSELKDLEMNLSVWMEIRAGKLHKEDFRLMRDAGVKAVYIGVEALGSRMLKKMNKGVRAIDNIAAIKHCQEFGILPLYLIMCNYPNEEEADLRETADNIRFLRGLIPPLQINPLWLGYGSPIYNHLSEFNIRETRLPEHALWSFPEENWQTLTSFFHEFTPLDGKQDSTARWKDVFGPWQQTGRERIASPLLFHQDMGECLTITDMLSEKSSKAILKGIERELFLFCDSPRKKSEILDRFRDHRAEELERILEMWIQNRWMFREEARYLSLSVMLNPSMSPLTYVSARSVTGPGRLLREWTPPAPRWRARLRMGSLLNVNVSFFLKSKPAWLRKIKKALTPGP